MKILSVREFIECYKPICAEINPQGRGKRMLPYPNGFLKDSLGAVIWDKRDFKHISHLTNRKCIWTICKYGKRFTEFYGELPDLAVILGIAKPHTCEYVLIPTINLEFGADTIGFVVTEIPYNSNDVSNILVPVCKEKEDCEITLDDEV